MVEQIAWAATYLLSSASCWPRMLTVSHSSGSMSFSLCLGPESSRHYTHVFSALSVAHSRVYSAVHILWRRPPIASILPHRSGLKRYSDSCGPRKFFLLTSLDMFPEPAALVIEVTVMVYKNSSSWTVCSHRSSPSSTKPPLTATKSHHERTRLRKYQR